MVKGIEDRYKKTEFENSTNSQQYLQAVITLGTFTENGTNCPNTCGQTVCDAYFILRNCSVTARQSCTYNNYTGPSGLNNYSDEEESCRNDLQTISDQCVAGNTSACCSATFRPECRFSNKIVEARNARRVCTNKTSVGSFAFCSNLVKNLASMINNCSTAPPPPQNVDQEETENVAETRNNVINRNTFVENGTSYEHTISYDPINEEAIITVPAHLDRVAVNIIVNAEQMVTATSDLCIVEDTPEDMDPANFADERSAATSPEEIEADERVKQYFVSSIGAELTEAEKEELSESAKRACEGRPIAWSTRESVEVEQFNNLQNNEGRVLVTDQSNSRQKRQLQTPFPASSNTIEGCTSVKVTCNISNIIIQHV